MRVLYNILAYMSMPILFLRLWWRSRDVPARWERWQERCGYSPILRECIWVHAVSLGETLAALPLINKIIQNYPNTPILVTNMTLTGSDQVNKQLGNSVINAYIPFDTPLFVRRFFERSHPKIAIILETELWPNLFRQCELRKIPLVVTNARLSQKSAEGYQRFFASLMRWMMRCVTLLACQASADGERFLRLGLAKEKLFVTGNIKFDITVSPEILQKGINLKQQIGNNRFIWVAASTHDTEEKLMLDAHKMVLKKFPNALLILVPRHPERFDAVAELLQTEHWKFSRRSLQQTIIPETQVYLSDTLGEMMVVFAACDVAVVAGSFKPIGGHNVLEPAALAKPIISGPHVCNFLQAVNLLKDADAIDIVENSAESLATTLCGFAADVQLCEEKGARALDVVEANRGALDKQFALIEKILKQQ
ncbi:MAG: lipid IV(A) 3-deoxy-D-manno-octulosonic acid transferase [Gammaproteobacteria bacterium]|nr:lipid IV(A) 3-deoxy-D-manno-octulosonic acid transferase [Gammaproteobacteria bacterium]